MFISICMVGTIRPSVHRVYTNILQTIQSCQEYHNNQHTFEYIVTTYACDDAESLRRLLHNTSVRFHTVDKVATPAHVHISRVNTHRLFYSMEASVLYAQGDAVFRTRLDCALEKVVFPREAIDTNTYYVARDHDGITDNVGFASKYATALVWRVTHAHMAGRDNEAILENAVRSVGLSICTENSPDWRLHMYQSNETHHDGIPQWSRKNRIFESLSGKLIKHNESGLGQLQFGKS